MKTAQEALSDTTVVRAGKIVDRIMTQINAHRVMMEFEAFPVGHPDRQVRPAHVLEWEAKHGKAPESARRFLDGR